MAELEDFRIGKIGKLEKVGKSVEAFKRFARQQAPDGLPTDRSYFDSLMRQERKGMNQKAVPDKVTNGEEQSVRKSLYEHAGDAARGMGVADPSKPSTVDLIAQAQAAVDKIEGIKRELGTPELQIKNSVQRLLKNKLGNINDNLKVAFAKAGIDYVPPEQRGLRTNPLVNFFDMLANGQHNLENLTSHVQAAAASETEIRPQDVLMIQLKVAHVQQELELFSNLLNKTLESSKTLMNVQV